MRTLLVMEISTLGDRWRLALEESPGLVDSVVLECSTRKRVVELADGSRMAYEEWTLVDRLAWIYTEGADSKGTIPGAAYGIERRGPSVIILDDKRAKTRLIREMMCRGVCPANLRWEDLMADVAVQPSSTAIARPGRKLFYRVVQLHVDALDALKRAARFFVGGGVK